MRGIEGWLNTIPDEASANAEVMSFAITPAVEIVVDVLVYAPSSSHDLGAGSSSRWSLVASEAYEQLCQPQSTQANPLPSVILSSSFSGILCQGIYSLQALVHNHFIVTHAAGRAV